MMTHNGGYFYSNPFTKYRGLYLPVQKDKVSWTLFKIIDFVDFKKKPSVVVNKFTRIETDVADYYYEDGNLIIDVKEDNEMTFTLDMREIYDFDDQGRIYTIEKEGTKIDVHYVSYTSNMLEHLRYQRSITLETDLTFMPIKKWREQHYPEDAQRKSQPDTLYVYDAFKLKGKGRISIGISSVDKQWEIEKIKAPNEYILAYNAALVSIKDLHVRLQDIEGFYAGLPWFFQFWTRDEAIAANMIEDSKNILMSRLQEMKKNGRVPNRYPYAELGTADGTGWIFYRLSQLDLDQSQKVFVKERLAWAIEDIMNLNVDDYIVRSGPLETWMDTASGSDMREGYCIEIQALWLAMLRFHNSFSDEYKTYEENVRQEVRKRFFREGVLRDRAESEDVRPNIFLAYYVYPDLLSDDEWKSAFDYVLDKLWLPWGGISTISKDSSLYCPEYTGEDNKSYHHGDSWFFINNIAAMCMHHLDEKLYKEYIQDIVESSTKDVLYMGIAGRPSELSSAKQHTAQASLFQLWSASSYVELMRMLYG